MNKIICRVILASRCLFLAFKSPPSPGLVIFVFYYEYYVFMTLKIVIIYSKPRMRTKTFLSFLPSFSAASLFASPCPAPPVEF